MYRNNMTVLLHATYFGVFFLMYACAPSKFAGNSNKKDSVNTSTQGQPIANGQPATDIASDQAKPDLDVQTTSKPQKCSEQYKVPGTANLWLAGAPNGTSLSYTAGKKQSVDSAPAHSPVEVIPSMAECLKPGATIAFDVAGKISHGNSGFTDGDGDLRYIPSHQKHAVLGKSDITAPINSMIAVFTGDQPLNVSNPPPALNYAQQAQRDLDVQNPLLNQIFFIGNGVNASGKQQQFIVPEGTRHLYLGIMDEFEWNNNSGELQGGIVFIPQ